MRVEQLMTKQTTCCSSSDTLSHAAQLMWEHDCGCLPVCSSDSSHRVEGMITDRDICMSSLFRGKALNELHVGDAMASNVQVCHAKDSIADAERIMSSAKIRRLPVVNDEGGLIGMLSLADLAREAEREQVKQKPDVTRSEIGVTLASICRPQQGAEPQLH